jgi:hypothetical protein
MDTELAALAKAGAATLVALMTSDLWTQARGGFTRLFARNATAGTRTEHLEASRADLAIAHAAGDAAAAALIQAEWQARIDQLLRSDPAAAQDLRRLLRIPELSQAPTVHNVSSGNVHFGSVIQAGHISGNVLHVMPTSDGHADGHNTNPDDGSSS